VLAAGIDAAGVGVAAAKLTDAPPINDPATSTVTSTFFIYFSSFSALNLLFTGFNKYSSSV
jgi:hypothetical protein